jgi:tetratricopeptide (TPR) repeat protein
MEPGPVSDEQSARTPRDDARRGGSSRGAGRDAPRRGTDRGTDRGTGRDPRGGADREGQRGGSMLAPTKPRLPEPAIPEGVTGFELDRSVKNQLRTLSKENAVGVGQHLVMVATFLDTDIEAAQAHAETAVRRAGRVPATREALGLVHYRKGEWAKALSEFRTARRLSGSSHLLPYMVDAERGLGRAERALDLAASPEAANLGQDERIELAIVVSGIRRDLGQYEAAAVGLQVPELKAGARQPWAPRLFYAYAEALLAKGDDSGALTWFSHAAHADVEGGTDADERVSELSGLVLTDLLDDEENPDPAGT